MTYSWAFLVVAVVLVLTPGADFALIVRNSVSGGRRYGIATTVSSPDESVRGPESGRISRASVYQQGCSPMMGRAGLHGWVRRRGERPAIGNVPVVVTDRAQSWWEDSNDDILRARETGWGGGDVPLLSRAMCELLDDVDAAFAVTGSQTPGWPNPYKDGPSPGEEACERSSNPEKYRIVVARAQAWTQVLLDRGWAREASHVDWALPPMEPGGADTVLEPAADGAVPLVLTTHTPMDGDHPFNITIAAGDPAVTLATLPDCACDGCDSGSAVLLKDMDMLVLSVVDGSLDVDVGDDYYWVRTSFNVKGSGTQNRHTRTAFTAAPWPANWTARPLPERQSLRRP